MLSDANELMGKQEIARGKQAVKLNLIDEYQLIDSINILSKLREMGLEQKSLSDILVEKGYIARNTWEKIDSKASLLTENLSQVEDLASTGLQMEKLSSVESMSQFEKFSSTESESPLANKGLEALPITDSETHLDSNMFSGNLDNLLLKQDNCFSIPEKPQEGEEKFLCPENPKNSNGENRLVDPDGKTDLLSIVSGKQERQKHPEETFEFNENLLPEEAVSQKSKQVKQNGQARENWPKIPGYKFISILGQGSMGQVFKAMQVSMQREVAIKVLAKKLSDNHDFVERFVRETRAVARLSHENIVAGIDAGKTEKGVHYFVMEFVQGEPVSKILKRIGKLPARNAVKITLQIARAMKHAHKHKIIHRDIKPENIMMDGDMAKLCDLGLVKDENMDSQITMAGMALGTPHYISPEQARGEKYVDIRSDIYSLGVSLYHMIVGSLPFPQSNLAVVCMMHATKKLPDPRKIDPNVDDFVCKIIRKCTEKERDLRYQKPGRLVKDLEICLQRLKGKVSPNSPNRKKEKISPVPLDRKSELELLPLEKKPISLAKTRLNAKPKNLEKNLSRKKTVTKCRPVMVREKSNLLLIWGIVASMAALAGVGYFIYPLVERSIYPAKKQKITSQGIKSVDDDNLQMVWKELRMLNELYSFSSSTEEKQVAKRLEKYRQLLEKYCDNKAAVALIEKDHNAFQRVLEREAEKSYRDLVRDSNKAALRYQANDDPVNLRLAYKILKGYPQAFRKFTSQGKKFLARFSQAKYAIDQRIARDLKKATTLKNEKKYREAWEICRTLNRYALPSQLDKIKSVMEDTQRQLKDCIAKAEKKYTPNLVRKFYDALFQENYHKAEQICRDSMANRKYYGLLDRLALMAGDLALLEKSASKLANVEIEGKRTLSQRDLLENMPKLAATDRRRQLWVMGMLFCRKHSWARAKECFSELPAEPGQILCLDYIQAKLCELQARRLWEKARRQVNNKKYLLARASVYRLREELQDTRYVKKKQKQIVKLSKKIETGYLKRYAIPLFYQGRFSKFPTSRNDFAFCVYYNLALAKNLRDFFITRDQCKLNVKKGWNIDFDKDGLFEVYWNGKLRSFERMSVKVKFTKSSKHANVGLSLYKQPPLKHFDNLDRYLYLIYYQPSQMCRSEIFNKAKSYKNYADYRDIFAKKNDNTFRPVLCLTEGKAGTLPRRIEQVIKKKSTSLRKKKWKLSVKVMKNQNHQFDFFTYKCDRFSTGYFGLYANSDVIFSDLTIAGKLDQNMAKDIVEKVLKDREKYLRVKAYWEDY